jgi:hypothetical protein
LLEHNNPLNRPSTHTTMPLELDPESIAVLTQGRKDRDDHVGIFLVVIAIFFGNLIANGLWNASGFDQATNTVITAISLGVLIVVEAVVVGYRWMELEWCRTVVLLTGDYVYDLIQVFVALLIGSAINQRWEYGSVYNILVNFICFSVMAVLWLWYKHYKNNQIQLATAMSYQQKNSQLTLEEALSEVNSYIKHDNRIKGELSIASFLNIRVSTPSEDRESFKKHKLFPPSQSTYVSGRRKL